MPWVAAIAAAVGAAGGAEKDKSWSGQDSESWMQLDPETDLEKYGKNLTQGGLKELEKYVNAGPGLSAMGNANQANEGLASLLGDFAKTGGLPGQQDYLSAQEMAKQQFAPQQLMLNQSFEDEQVRAKQLAVQLGRPVNDPYIQAQLSKERMRQQQMMGAQQGAFISSQAQGLAGNRLGYTSQLADVRNSLASQAMANRQALLSLGNTVQQQERNFRLQTARKFGKASQQNESGGGLKGAIGGAFAGAGSVMGMGGGGMMGGGGGQGGGAPSGGGGQFSSMGMLGANTDLGYGQQMQPNQFGMTTNFGQLNSGTQQRQSRFNQPLYSRGGPGGIERY